jgi:anti-anti-sigma factor
MIHNQETAEAIILTPAGALDFEGVRQLQSILADSLTRQKAIEIDLGQVPGLTSSAIGAMIAAHNTLRKRSQKLQVRNAGAEVSRLFTIMGLDKHFDIKAG